MPVRKISQTEFLELPDWKERILNAISSYSRLPYKEGPHPFFIEKEYLENPLDDWEDVAEGEEWNPFNIIKKFPPGKSKEVTKYLLRNMDHATAFRWGDFLLRWLHETFGPDREILGEWSRAFGNLAFGEKELARLAIWGMPLARDMIDLFPDEIDWENVLNLALKGALSPAPEKPPFDYVLEELVNFVHARNPSFLPDY